MSDELSDAVNGIVKHTAKQIDCGRECCFPSLLRNVFRVPLRTLHFSRLLPSLLVQIPSMSLPTSEDEVFSTISFPHLYLPEHTVSLTRTALEESLVRPAPFFFRKLVFSVSWSTPRLSRDSRSR